MYLISILDSPFVLNKICDAQHVILYTQVMIGYGRASAIYKGFDERIGVT